MNIMGTVLKFIRPSPAASTVEPTTATMLLGDPLGDPGQGDPEGCPPVPRTMVEATAELLDELLVGFTTLAQTHGIERGDDLQLDLIRKYYERHSVSRGWPEQHRDELAKNLIALGCASSRRRMKDDRRVRVIVFPDAARLLEMSRSQKKRLAKSRKSKRT